MFKKKEGKTRKGALEKEVGSIQKGISRKDKLFIAQASVNTPKYVKKKMMQLIVFTILYLVTKMAFHSVMLILMICLTSLQPRQKGSYLTASCVLL